MPTADQLALAEILDRAGFAYLEVSGGGCFDSAVKRGLESPWERIRALKARVRTPLGLALRGRFLVGSRPVDADFARRFVASAAENGIDVFRLHDPLNDVSNLREAAEAIAAADRDFEAGLVYSPGPTGEIDILIERAKALPELGAVRVLLHDPTGSLQPHKAEDLVHARGVRLPAAGGAVRRRARLAGAPQRSRGEPLSDDRRRAPRPRVRPIRRAAGPDRPGARARRRADDRPGERRGRRAGTERGARAG